MEYAYAYLRVSGPSQVGNNGYPRQAETVERYALTAGYLLLAEFTETAVSGKTEEEARPAFQDMVYALLKSGVKYVVIEGLDRLARELRVQESLLIYLASKGISLISARTEENVTEAMMSDPMRKAMVQIQGVFAELEKSLLVKKLKHARDRVKAEKGKCSGQKSWLEKDPDFMLECRRMKQSGMTYYQIADYWNARGRMNSVGTPWTYRALLMAMTRPVNGGKGMRKRKSPAVKSEAVTV